VKTDAPVRHGKRRHGLIEVATTVVMSWITREPKPANDQPGLIYMLHGGSGISATDPWATKTDKFIYQRRAGALA
jgi:hypothetical protein